MRPLTHALIAALMSYAVLRALLATRLPGKFLDRASARSMHSGAIPRVGGLGIAAAVAAALALVDAGAWPAGMVSLALATGAVLALSLIDDLRPLPATTRLVVHLSSALLLSLALGIAPAWLPLATVAIAWATNLYNFMDGADGLAGGMTVSGFGVLAIAAYGAGEPAIATLCAVIAGAALGFLPLNWHPARVFLGDAGSIPLGFSAGAISTIGVVRGWWPAAVPVVAFFPFVFDASVTLARRGLRGARLAQAHREHLYQRAALAGLGHRRVAFGAYCLMAVSAVAALMARQFSASLQLAILCAVCALHIGVLLLVRRWIASSPEH